MSTFDLQRAIDSSDSEDDEDYVPSGEENEDSISGDDHEPLSDEEESGPKSSKTRKKHKGGIVPKKRRGKIKPEERKEDKQDHSHNADTADGIVQSGRMSPEKKEGADLLWSDFLKDVDPLPRKRPISITASSQPTSKEWSSNSQPSPTPTQDKKVKITAGKEVNVDSKEAEEFSKGHEQSPVLEKLGPGASIKRPGGAGTVLGKLMNKKQKISTLERSKIDWNSYKKCEGIEGDLSIHNRGKDGYLEKQAFLQRADLRQFEVEKSMRAKNRLSNLT